MKITEALKKNANTVSNALFIVCAYGVLVYWLRRCLLSPDSTNYLAAASNLVENGRMFVFTNWPSTTLDPVEIPYTVQPFGFPFYLAAFIAIFKNAFIAAVIAQSAAIGLFFAALWWAMRLAGLKFWTRISLLVIVCSLESFTEIFANLWTEPLFIALTLFLAISVHYSFNLRSRKSTFAISVILLALTSALRFIGVFNLGFFLPALLKRELKFRTFVALGFAALSPNVIWYFRNRRITGGNFAEHYGWSISGFIPRLHNILASLKFSLAFDSFYVLALLVFLVICAALIANRPPKPSMKTGHERNFGQVVLAGTLGQFIGLSSIGVFSGIGDLLVPHGEQARLFATTYFLIFLWFHTVANQLPRRGYALAVFMMIGLLGNTAFFSLRSRVEFIPHVRFPAEYFLWNEIREMPEVKRSRFFYSDYDFIHQVFSGKTQRIIWDGVADIKNLSPATESQILKGLESNDHPFFLLGRKSMLQEFIDKKTIVWNLAKFDLSKFGFYLYFKK